MGIGQPGMEGYDRQLDRERDEKSQHDPECRGWRQDGIHQVEIVEGEDTAAAVMGKYQRQYRQQHQQAASLGEDEKLDRCVTAVLVAPDSDHEIHRHQHQFPEKEEEEQIERKEYADGASQSPQQVKIKESGAFPDFG